MGEGERTESDGFLGGIFDDNGYTKVEKIL